MWIVTHRLNSASEFMDRYLPDGEIGGLFLPQKFGMKQGAIVSLELHLTWIDEVHFIQATVERVNMLHDNCGKRQKGSIVRFNAEQKPAVDEILRLVKASAEAVQTRGAERKPFALSAHYFRQSDHPLPGHVVDLSCEGALVRGRKALPVGTPIHLRVEDRARKAFAHLRGRVTRLDIDAEGPAMGVAFDFADRSERQKARQLFDHLTAVHEAEAEAAARAAQAPARARATDRTAITLPVRCADGHALARSGQAVDISLTGMFVETDQPYPTGARVDVYFEQAGPGLIRRVTGYVTRQVTEGARAGMGVAFELKNAKERRSLKRWLAAAAVPA